MKKKLFIVLCVLFTLRILSRLNTREKSHVETRSETQVSSLNVIRDHFVSQAIIFLIAGGLVMSRADIVVTSFSFMGRQIPWISFPYMANVSVAGLLVVFSLFLMGLAIAAKPRKWLVYIYNITVYASSIQLIVFSIGWINVLVNLIEAQVAPWFVETYSLIGFTFIIVLVIRQIVVAMKRRVDFNSL